MAKMNRDGRLPKKARDHILSVALADIKRADDYYETYIQDTLTERYQIYKADKDYYREKFPNLSEKSDVVSYDVWAAVEQIVPTMMSSVLGSNQVATIVGVGDEDIPKAETLRKLVEYQLSVENEGYSIIHDLIVDGLATNLGLIKIWWDRKVDSQQFTDTLDPMGFQALMSDPEVEIIHAEEPQGAMITTTWVRTRVIRNRPVIENVRPFEIRFLPETRKIDNTAPFVAHRKIVTASDLRKKARDGVYDKKAVNAAIESAGSVDYTTLEIELNEALDEQVHGMVESARSRLVLYECYMQVDVNGDGILEDAIVTVCGDQLLRAVENPYGRHLFFSFIPWADPYKVFADVSLAEIAGEIQHIYVAVIRQLLVNIALNNNPKTYIDELKVNLNDLDSDRQWVRVKGMPSAAISTAPIQPIAAWTMSTLEYLETKMEKFIGRTRYDQGIVQGSSLNKTATGVSMVMKAANQRVEQLVRSFAEATMKHALRFLVQLNQMYITEPQTIRLTGERLNVAPDDIRGCFDVDIDTAVGIGDKEQSVQNLQLYLTMLHPQGMQMGKTSPNTWEYAARKLMHLAGMSNAERLFEQGGMPYGPGAPGTPPVPGGGGKPGQGLSQLPPGLAGKIAGGLPAGAGKLPAGR